MTLSKMFMGGAVAGAPCVRCAEAAVVVKKLDQTGKTPLKLFRYCFLVKKHIHVYVSVLISESLQKLKSPNLQ